VPDAKLKSANPYARPAEAVREPPTGWWGTLRFLGPSFILIGSIVGSGELILTTAMGAQLGFTALWFIIVACLCKTVVQAELGRYTISSGDTCLEAFNRLPGPRLRVSWFIWLWILWQIPGVINSAGILGSTGQVLAVAFPFMEQQHWALVIAVFNVSILLIGRYSFLERASTFMVISFSIITVVGAIALQLTDRAVPWQEAMDGLRIQLAPLLAPAAIAIVVSAFAGTGVGGGEMMSYTYWCVEKGYARFAGEPDGTESWARRARGWVRVMQVDVWLATVIFTSTTIAFFWLGAGILHRNGMQVESDQMITTLQHIYTSSLGPWASALFLVGAFFVLYSTIFSGTAGASRLYADALGVFKLVDFTDFHARMKWIRIFTVVIPAMQAALFFARVEPKEMIMVGAVAGALLLPILVFGTMWLRYKRTDRRIAPSLATDLILWPCALIILGVSLAYLWVKVIQGQ
jgi:Mn2+/Fe2+ NRAMP family transporter